MVGGTSPLLPRNTTEQYDTVLWTVAQAITNNTERHQFTRTFSREELLKAYAKGVTELSMDYLFRPAPNARPIWARLTARLIRRPGSNDIIAFNAVSDIDHMKTIDIIMKNTLVSQYDYITSIDVSTGKVAFIGVNLNNDMMDDILSGSDFDKITDICIQKHVAPDNQNAYKAYFNLERVVQKLDNEKQYEGIFRVLEDGTERYKRMIFSYIDRESKLLSLIQMDVTDLWKNQAEHEAALSAALIAAKQASSAKTNFLSRMSHEIRTPLNAIIGMDTIAAHNIENPEKMADCISKIGISARFLLSLINDILDMSRIESGKMLLKNERFLFRDFISDINTVIYNQTKAKGLDYECVVSSEIAEAYIGDSMKLQQIFVNILANAVKFTKTGKIFFDVRPLSGNGKQSTICFMINDTGVGIPEEMLENIFEPFEQGDSSTTATFGGTGLGLAITKSLVDLMNGSIRVRSIVGVGSEFTVEIPLTIDEETIATPLTDQTFDKSRALIVDDDLIVCEQTCNILRDIGMKSEWVSTGTEAIQKVRDNFERSLLYDYILIDWKMPDISGIETTRQVRSIVGPDVTIIIITAYDWEAIEVEARAAGANMLISKPLFKSSLVSAFEKTKGIAPEGEKAEVNFDFTGRHVLLAEDNAINAEIAKALLEEKKFTVDLAQNGLKALEMFIRNPIGTYDAILMDIRMPLMDGLQATLNIRHWDREDAKTIPIIAMTANAFDEDVEKSRASGMSAHLSKPIEPNIMYATLERLIK